MTIINIFFRKKCAGLFSQIFTHTKYKHTRYKVIIIPALSCSRIMLT